jgi:iron(III) transport system substrate-binding protein
MRRASVLAALAAVLVSALPACGSGGGERVVVYSGRTRNLIGPLLERFAKQTGVSVEVRYGDSADLALLIDREGDRSPADVFISQSPGPIAFLAARGRLARLPESVLDLVAAENRSPRGLWVGLSGRVRVLVYNTRMVRPDALPRSVMDLTGPAFRDKVAVAPTNGSFQDFVSGMRLALGDDATLAWLRGMRANGARAYANNTAIVEAVARGEVPMGLVNHYYNLRYQAEHPGAPTANHAFPADDIGSLLIVTGVGVRAGADHPAQAQRLVRFLLAREAQEYFARETFEYPLAAGVRPAPGVPPAASLGARRLDFDALGDSLVRTRELIDRSGLERG